MRRMVIGKIIIWCLVAFVGYSIGTWIKAAGFQEGWQEARKLYEDRCDYESHLLKNCMKEMIACQLNKRGQK